VIAQAMDIAATELATAHLAGREMTASSAHVLLTAVDTACATTELAIASTDGVELIVRSA